jgi:hypothetical protein
MKCKHCPKFFLSQQYLQKHYQRHHPQIDFAKDFAEDGGDRHATSQVDEIKGRQEELQKTVNQRLVDMARQMDEEKASKVRQQDELFNKIKNELFSNLADNFRRVEQELSNLKSSRQTYED